MIAKIYIVSYNGKVSSEGYYKVEDAITFIESRSRKPIAIGNWKWSDQRGDIYKINEINLK